ncbi:MAG: efflux RND transporter periplasmic adaptor subunit [Pirellulales bacterium]
MSDKNQKTQAPDVAAEPVDLRQLSFERRTPASSALKMPRHLFSRYVAPIGLLGAFAGLMVWSARDSFLPAQDVTVTPVIVTRAEVQQEGTPLFQAAGWVEPRPTAVTVSSLASGVIEQLLVVEGERVEKGQPLVKLVETDAKLALQQTEANLRLADSDARSAETALAAAKTALENPNELKAALADSESLLEETKLSLGNLPYTIEAAVTRRQLAADNVDRKESAGAAIAGRVLREARADLAAADSALAELRARKPTLEAQVAALERKRVALSQQLELMTEQKRAVSAAEGVLAAAQARRDQAQLTVDVARLNLDRMVIRAPISGRVLTVDARPGKALAGLDPLSVQNSSAVVSLYDPDSLQVRVDVRLEDVPQVRIGQPASIETAALGKPVEGEVLWVTSRADIQKNTLQVKVAINQPPDVITPEMLAQVTFLAPSQPSDTAGTDQEPLRLLVPRALVAGTEGSSSVWIVDPLSGAACRQTVQLGRAGTDELVEIAQGLDPTAKLIVSGRESLADGSRIRVVAEEASQSNWSHTTAGRASEQASKPHAANLAK